MGNATIAFPGAGDDESRGSGRRTQEKRRSKKETTYVAVRLQLRAVSAEDDVVAFACFAASSPDVEWRCDLQLETNY